MKKSLTGETWAKLYSSIQVGEMREPFIFKLLAEKVSNSGQTNPEEERQDPKGPKRKEEQC
jgi:hypothetical protein